MSVITSYRFRLLTLRDFDTVYDIPDMLKIIKIWRTGYSFEKVCSVCRRRFDYSSANFHTCCGKFYFTDTEAYMIKSLAVRTPGIPLMSNYLRTKLLQRGMIDEYAAQDFLVLPDPIYWKLESTLIYDLALKFLKDPYRYCTSDDDDDDGKKKNKNNNGGGDFETRIAKLFLRLQNAPLLQCSMSHRTQGKHSLYRKIALAKRAELTGRAMIVPAPFLKPNEIVLPRCMSMYEDLYLLVNRMPSLWSLNLLGLKIRGFWDSNCIGIPPEINYSCHSDFDGDELNTHFLLLPSSQSECRHILDCENNMRSFCNQMKVFPSQDAIIAYYISKHLPLKEKYPSLPEFLQLVFELEGSKSCFEYCNLFREHYLHILEHEVSFSVSFREFQFLERVATETGSFDAFVEYLKTVPHEEGCLEIQVKSGAKGTFYHLWQIIASLGPQKQTLGNFEMVQSSFLKGLTPQEYIFHARSGHDALIESSIGVWRPGYEYFKIVNNTQNIVVTYDGKLVNGDYVISTDALSETHPTEIISGVTFDYVFDRYFPASR